MTKKEYTPKEVLEELRKSLYKMVCKALTSIKKGKYNKEITQEIVQDILDPNTTAEVDNKKIPAKTHSVLYKKKGVEKLKAFKDKAE